MKIIVFSTLANDNAYTEYAKGGSDLPVAVRSVLIKGGTGVTDSRLVTPQGVATEIEPEDLALLKGNSLFLLHEKNGFVKVAESKSSKAPDQDEIAEITADMSTNDPSRQPIFGDFKADQGQADQATELSTASSGKAAKSGKSK
jgi:hypothetical protein